MLGALGKAGSNIGDCFPKLVAQFGSFSPAQTVRCNDTVDHVGKHGDRRTILHLHRNDRLTVATTPNRSVTPGSSGRAPEPRGGLAITPRCLRQPPS